MSGQANKLILNYQHCDSSNIVLGSKGKKVGNFGYFFPYFYQVGKETKMFDVAVSQPYVVPFEPDFTDGVMRDQNDAGPEPANIKKASITIKLGNADEYQDDALFNLNKNIDEYTADLLANQTDDNNPYGMEGETKDDNLKTLKGKKKGKGSDFESYDWKKLRRLIKFPNKKKEDGTKVLNEEFGPTMRLDISGLKNEEDEDGERKIYRDDIYLFGPNKEAIPFTMENVKKNITKGTWITFIYRVSLFCGNQYISIRATPTQIRFQPGSSSVPRDTLSSALLMPEEVEEENEDKQNKDKDFEEDEQENDKPSEKEDSNENEEEENEKQEENSNDGEEVALSDDNKDEVQSDNEEEEEQAPQPAPQPTKNKVTRKRTTTRKTG